MSPNMLSSAGYLENNPFEAEFNGDYDDDISTCPTDSEIDNNSSLPKQLSEQHNLASCANARCLLLKKINSIGQNGTSVSRADCY